LSDGRISPWAARAKPEKYSKKPAVQPSTSKRDSRMGLPTSREMIRASRSQSAWISSATRLRYPARSPGVSAAHAGCAACAASSATWASSSVACGTSANGCPVHGLMTGAVSRSPAATHASPTRMLVSSSTPAPFVLTAAA
jgi:hypothetical protein